MALFSNILRRYQPAIPFILATIGLTGLLLATIGGVGLWRKVQHHKALERLNTRLASVSGIKEHAAAAAELEKITADAEKSGLSLPQAEYALLARTWRARVDDFKQITAALNNRYLAVSQQQDLKTFHEQLLALRDSCTAALENPEALFAPMQWKLHNLKGNVSVMLAYSVLAFEQDGRKAAKFLSDAVDDYKTAIDLVDGLRSTSLQRAIPRWNLELIVGLGEYRRIGLSEIPQENMSEVQEQLEAFIPDVAGFAPGVPLDTRVEK